MVDLNVIMEVMNLRGLGHKSFNRTLLFASVIFISLIFNYENCSDVRLLKNKKLSQNSLSVTESASTKLPPPIQKPQNVRVMIVFDQSFSMIHSKCPQDLDGAIPLPDGNNAGCVAAGTELPEGSDINGHRFDVIGSWLRDLNFMNIFSKDSGLPGSPVKVSIIPFSGGLLKRGATPEETAKMGFFSPDDIAHLPSVWLAQLRKEQDDEKTNVSNSHGAPAKFLGTSVPADSIRRNALPILKREVEELRAAGILATTPIQIVFMTDGVPRPLQAQYDYGFYNLIGCPSSSGCAGTPDNPACSKDSSDTAGYSYPSPFDICNTIYPNYFRESFGDPNDNNYSTILQMLQQIQDIPKDPKYGAAKIQLKLVQIHPEKIPKDEVGSDNSNMFDPLWKDLKTQAYSIQGPTPPFSLLGGGGALSFQIASIYAINLNAFVNPRGVLVVDSDGDGLSDEEEVLYHTNPLLPRTNGTCLDSMVQKYGCYTIQCSNSVDLDGDYLNDCEEKTLKTDVANKDSDGDSLLDGLEIIRGTDPTVNESRHSRLGDQWSDLYRVFSGLSPTTPKSLARSQDMIQLAVTQYNSFAPMSSTVPPGPMSATSATYRISIKNLPLMPTLATPKSPNGDFPTRPSTASLPRGSSSMILGPTPHEAGDNQILIIIKAQARENPQFTYWLAKSFTVNYYHPDPAIFKQIDFSDFQQLDFMNDGSSP